MTEYAEDPMKVIEDRIQYLDEYPARDASHRQSLKERQEELQIIRKRIRPEDPADDRNVVYVLRTSYGTPFRGYTNPDEAHEDPAYQRSPDHPKVTAETITPVRIYDKIPDRLKENNEQ